jgi:hypothetical protein
MQSIIKTHAQRSNQLEEFYAECLDKAIGRIKRAYKEEQSTHMILRVGEIAGLKGFLPPCSMHDPVKIVCIGLEKAGVRAHKCHDPHHLSVTWGDVLKKSMRPHVWVDKQSRPLEYATADGGPRFAFKGDRGASVPLLDMIENSLKVKQVFAGVSCTQKRTDKNATLIAN